jgi:hypothetical protein
VEILVIYTDPNTRRVTFKIQPKVASGILKLTQIVLLSLLNIPGQDVLDPELGGGIPELISFNFGAGDFNEIAAEVTRRVRKTEAEVLEQQIGLTVPASERLQEIQIVSIEEGDAIDAVFVRLRITNELGQQQDVVI